MYDYIFYTLYKYNLKDGKGYGKFNGIIIVGLALFIHLALIISLIKKTSPYLWTKVPATYLSNYKIIVILFLVFTCLILYFYYGKNRIERILSKRPPINVNAPNGWDILWVGSLILIPVVLILILNWK